MPLSASSFALWELLSATLLALGEFPAESVPDGEPFAPHHFLYAIYFAFLLALTAWDDFPQREPIFVCGSLVLALFGFLHTWEWYPELGASLVLLGMLASSVSLLRPGWNDWSQRVRIGVGILLLVAWDDAISHAFGVWTPLDWLWKAYVWGLVA